MTTDQFERFRDQIRRELAAGDSRGSIPAEPRTVGVDPGQWRLGAIASPTDPMQLRLTDFLIPSELPARRPSFTNEAVVAQWLMLGNDHAGDCVFAKKWHWIMLQQALMGKPVAVDAELVLKEYFAWTGGRDVGAVIRDTLKAWRKAAPIGSDLKLLGFAGIDPRDDEVTRIAIDIFGAVDRGILLPNSAVPQSTPTSQWKAPQNLSDPNNRPGSWGGHNVLDIGYDGDSLRTVTWGYVQDVNDNFYPTYSMESYALVPDRRVPGFDYDKYVAALHALTGDIDIDPVPVPPAPPAPVGPTPPSPDWLPTKEQLSEYVLKVMGPFRTFSADLNLVTEKGINWPVHLDGTVR